MKEKIQKYKEELKKTEPKIPTASPATITKTTKNWHFK